MDEMEDAAKAEAEAIRQQQPAAYQPRSNGATPANELTRLNTTIETLYQQKRQQMTDLQARHKQWTFEEAIEHKVFTIIGQGSIDFPAFFRTLAKNGYSGWSVVEQDVKFGDPTIRPAESIAASLKYLREVVTNLNIIA